ncbi:hypothetical protein HUG10_16855 [Halorarum halophilum]|uniref:Uncharacterized protein n=1 Tax=Halorarum halophilum TaxID=2743090 RepID=A0A7D5KN73_9EURY|nr:hypothetical protein [Halobaculum halophilum]QLG29095.1 hypothetical protein HUG10_16855 [Halobaculum halophilum]
MARLGRSTEFSSPCECGGILKIDSDDRAGEIGALGAGAGVAVGVVFVSDGNPLLWASVGAIAGLLIGLLVAELG